MFKKAALIFTVLTSLTMANARAIDYELVNGSGHVIAQIGARMTIKRVDQSSIRVKWIAHYGSRDGGVHNTSHAAAFYVTAKTVFLGGTRANAVAGAVVHIIYHFEGDMPSPILCNSSPVPRTSKRFTPSNARRDVMIIDSNERKNWQELNLEREKAGLQLVT